MIAPVVQLLALLSVASIAAACAVGALKAALLIVFVEASALAVWALLNHRGEGR